MDLCQECNTYLPHTVCFDCDQYLCPICDSQLHRGGKRKSHTRQTLCFTCKALSTYTCASCSTILCGPCSQSHSSHELQQITLRKTVGIYWEFDRSIILELKDVEQTWAWIEKKFENIKFLKVYGEGCYKWKRVLDNYGAEYVDADGVKEDEAIFIDISMTRLSGITEALILSQTIKLIDVRLGRIQLGLPNVKIFVSGFPELKPERIMRIEATQAVGEQLKDQKNLQVKAMLEVSEAVCMHQLQEDEIDKSEPSNVISKNSGSMVGNEVSKVSNDDNSVRIKREPRMCQNRNSGNLSWKIIRPFIIIVVEGLKAGGMIQVLETEALSRNKQAILSRAKEIISQIPSLFWCCVKNLREGTGFKVPIYRDSPLKIEITQLTHNIIKKNIYEFVIFIFINILCLYCEYWGAREKDIKSGSFLDAKHIEGWKQHIKKLHTHLAAIMTVDKLKRLNLSTYLISKTYHY